MAANPSTNQRAANAGASSGQPASGPLHRGGQAMRGFWQRITEGMELSDLWSQFQSEARSSYGLYSREVDWAKIEGSKRWQKPFRTAWALFMAMLMKLTPARRILLLLALLLLPVQFESKHGGDLSVSPGFLSPGVMLLILLIALELADRVTMKRDLEIAREIQRWLVPEKPPDVPGYDIAFMSRPANTVAGDYYDTIPRGVARNAAIAGGKLLLVVADVAGKSVPAALLMATFQASLRAIEATGACLDDLVRNMNFYVCENSRNGLRFVTSFFAELDPASGAIHYTSAGHHPAMVRRTTGKIDELSAGGLPLGIEFGEKFPAGDAQLGAGELMFIYTDGLVEAVNAEGKEFGKDRLENLLFPCDANYSAAEVLAHVTRVLDSFVGSERQHDDITCMVVRRRA